MADSPQNETLFPRRLVEGYESFVTGRFSSEQQRYRTLAEQGQKPRVMMIGCCDSRVAPEVIFDAGPGEIFVVRNVANLVPPYNPDGERHGTSAAVEYAVTSLGVAHIIVLGHSGCGGVKGCHDMCAGHSPELEEKTSFVGRWLDILKPGYQRVSALPQADILRALEKQAVLVSLENLMTFPFVRDAVADDRLTLHGLWNNIGAGELEQYDPARDDFSPI